MARKEGRIPVSSQDFLLSRSVARSIVIVVRNRKGKMRVGTNLSFGIAMDVVVVRRYVRSLALPAALSMGISIYWFREVFSTVS